MGAFYGGIHLRNGSQEAVCALLGGLAKRSRKLLVSPSAGGWVSVYPNQHGQDDNLSKKIAKKCGGDLIHLVVHDDDVFYYWLYKNGKLVDKYSSCPDYFQQLSTTAKAEWTGKPELLAPLAAHATSTQSIAELLEKMRSAPLFFTSASPSELPNLLGISNAWTAYEYLMYGETDGVEGWDEFIHLPDLSSEQRRQQEREAQIAKAKRQMHQEGVLLLEHSKPSTARPLPVVSASKASPGFHICWPDDMQQTMLEECKPPWDSITSTQIQLLAGVFVMNDNSTGRFLGCGHGSGTWKASVTDLLEEHLITEIDQPRLVSWIGFIDASQQIVSISKNQITVADLPAGRVTMKCEIDRLQGSCDTGAIHQQSRTLVVGGQLGLIIIDLNSGKHIRTVPVVKQGPMIVTRQHLDDLDDLGLDFGDMTPDEITPEVIHEAAVKKLAEQFGSEFVQQISNQRQSEQVRRLEFSRDGKHLCCAVSDGLRVYEWEGFHKESVPIPSTVADAASTEVESQGMTMTMAHTYAMAVDERHNTVLFGGLGGCIKFLDLASGENGQLLSIPGLPALMDLRLATDGTTLCCVCQPDFLERNQRTPAMIQIWDYPKLRSIVGLRTH